MPRLHLCMPCMLQIFYSAACPSDLLKGRLCMFLGFWHPAKMAAEILWREHGGFFLAPAWQCMMPTSRYMRRPRLLTMTIFFNYIRSSYPLWQTELNTAIADVKAPSKLAALKNLRDLVSYYIPVIQDYLLSLKENNLEDVLHYWMHLLRIMALFKCKNYFRPMVLNSLYISWLQQVQHPAWDYLHECMSAFNEEFGEVSFSMLRGSTLKTSDRSQRDKLNKNYKLMKPAVEAESDFHIDATGEHVYVTS
jgi:hypothetical protein